MTPPSIDIMLDHIRTLLNEVDNLEAFQDRLIETFNYLEIYELSQVIQLGMSAAELAGRFEVQEE